MSQQDWVEGQGFSCDWKGPEAPCAKAKGSSLHRFEPDYGWQGVSRERYKQQDGSWMDVARQVLVGGRGEDCLFDLRYFEIAPGGHSTLEAHGHVHVVIGLRGRGRALVGGRMEEVGYLDCLYISPDDPHQLLNPFDEPFGFFCIVNRDRDRPRPLDAEQAERLRALGCDLRGGTEK